MGQKLKVIIACHATPDGRKMVNCPDCIHSVHSEIPKTKQKFLRDMIFSTGDFDEE
jgi:hypothetical protein